MQDLYEVGFQSPYGELGNTTRSQRYWDIVVPEEVSVPLRGIG